MGVDPGIGLLGTAAARMPKADVVISTLPDHGADGLAAELREGLHAAEASLGVLLDVAYQPRPTALAVVWARAGGLVVSGEQMLLHQAAEQLRLMTGLVPPVDAMRAALQARLEPAEE